MSGSGTMILQTSEHRDEIKNTGSRMAVRIVCIELKNYRSAWMPSKNCTIQWSCLHEDLG
jgi:hypothetical protein